MKKGLIAQSHMSSGQTEKWPPQPKKGVVLHFRFLRLFPLETEEPTCVRRERGTKGWSSSYPAPQPNIPSSFFCPLMPPQDAIRDAKEANTNNPAMAVQLVFESLQKTNAPASLILLT